MGLMHRSIASIYYLRNGNKGERRLLRFEADTQEQAIARGKAAMQDATSTADAWAFARDGLYERGGHKVDVLSVDFWANGMPKPVTLVQEYQPFAKSGMSRSPLKVDGDPGSRFTPR